MPVSNYQPSLVITQFIAAYGVYPGQSMPFSGGLAAPPTDEQASYYSMAMIRMFAGNFDPGADPVCQGQLLSIAENSALFSLIGTTYGGDGETTFALPDLGGRTAVGMGQGPGLFARVLGDQYGSSQFALNQANLPSGSGGSFQPVDNEQPALATNWLIRVQGTFQGNPSSVALGSIAQFAGGFVPTGHLPCDGRLLSINQNQALFAILGTTYGGNGVTTFALPDLRGRSVVGTGNGITLGETLGSTQLTLTSAVMPTDMGGSGGAIDNRAPGLALNYLIALQGVFPSQEDGSAPEDAHYLGEIIVFAGNTVPNGYARCEGQLLQISQNTALFALIGTQYGGDGRTTFALPDFRGRVAVGSDPNEGFDVGMTFGSSQVTLTSADMPPLTLNGGAGDDILYGGGSGDTLSGNDGADQLRGGAGGDTLNGGAGDDLLLGGSGADALNGDAGNDTVSYATSGAGVIARLGQVGIGGDAQGDTFTGIENLIGSAYADELRGSGGANRLEGGQGDDVLNGRGGADQLIGGSGSDTASYANAASGVIARLDGGAGTGEANGDVYDSIENLTGSNHNDTLTGSAGVNRLNGGDGDDVLTGGAGGDELNGGTGTDTASYATSASGVTVRLDNGQASGGDAEGDTFSSIENLVGSDHADSLRGNIGVNRLSGGAGDDVLVGRGGADVLNGGTGADTASYVGSAAGVTVQLDSGLATGGEAEGDVLSSIENLTGSDHNDSLRGNGVANRLAGGDGDDVLNGRGGADILSGGSGTDTATYVNSSAGVTARLDGGASTGGEAEGDTFSSIENLTGSGHDDVLIGSSGANRLAGGAGNDRLVGGGGDDTLTGNGGADMFDFRTAGGGQDVITDFAAGNSLNDVIWLSSAVFTDYADVLAHTTDDGLGNTVISKGGVHITLTGVLKAQLRSNDFDIAAPAPLMETAKDTGPQVLPDEAAAKTGLFSDDDAIICPVFEDGQATDVDTVGDDWSDPDPLVLPFDVGPKAAPSVPVVCDTGAGPDDPGHPIAFVTDTEALLSERGPNRLMSQPTWIDWVW